MTLTLPQESVELVAGHGPETAQDAVPGPEMEAGG